MQVRLAVRNLQVGATVLGGASRLHLLVGKGERVLIQLDLIVLYLDHLFHAFELVEFVLVEVVGGPSAGEDI